MSVERLGQMIRFHRKKSGLSQAKLALVAGIGKTALFDLEKGKATIQLDTLLKVLNILNIHMVFEGPLMGLFEEGL